MISTNPPWIPGIWSLVPVLTMVRLLVLKTEKCSNIILLSNNNNNRRQKGAARDITGRVRDKTGTTRDKTGTTRDKTRTDREKKGQGHNWTNAKRR